MTHFKIGTRFTTGVSAIVMAFAATALLATSCSTPVKTAAAPEAPKTQAVASTAAPAQSWAHMGTDLAPDPAVIFGVLPNGMRYAIRHNDRLPGRVAMRFQIAAGSMQERPDQAGLAHFLEHMAFAGSKNVPEDELMKMMQRLGSALGADTNASTSPQFTTYIFNLPNAEAGTIDTALMLFRETASELTLSPEAMERERGVVLAEERTRDSPGLRAALASLKATYGDHPAGLPPIGKVEVLKTAPIARIKEFYDAFYRPERATLIIVGDADTAALEAKVKARFADWKGRGANGANPPELDPAKAGPDFAMYNEAGLTAQVNLSWPTPLDRTPDTVAKAKTKVVENLALNMLNRRFRDIAEGPNPPFLSAFAGKGETPGVIGQMQVATAGATSVTGSIDAIVKSQRQAVQYGFNQQELDRAVTETRTGLQAAAAAMPTALTASLTAGLQGAASNDSVFRTPKQALDLFDEVTPTVKLDQVNASLRALFAGPGPKLFVTDAAEPQGGAAVIRTAFDAARTAPVTALAASEAKAWPYTSFGAPGKVASRHEAADLGITWVKFENGVRLAVKPTDYNKDNVQVRVMFGNGTLDLPKDKVSPLNMANAAFVSGGLGKITTKDWQRAFAGKSAGVNLTMAEGGFVLGGNPRPQDLQLQMQLLMAYLTDPAWESNGYDSQRAVMARQLAAIDRTPGGAFSMKSGIALHNGDQRWAAPTPELVNSMGVPDIKAAMTPLMDGTDLEVVIVGDVKLEEAIAQTAATFGTLPARKPRREPAGSRDVSFPAGTPQPIEVKHKGRADQAIAFIAWPTTAFYNDMEEVTYTRIMHLILIDRLREELREKQGKTYGVNGGVDYSKIFRNYGTMTVQTEVPPADVPGFYVAVDRIVADLKSKPVTKDELDRAIKPRKEELQRTFITNAYWSVSLLGAELEPRRINEIRMGAATYDKVTVEAVQAAAKRWLAPEKAWKMQVMPDPTAQPAPQAPAPPPAQ